MSKIITSTQQASLARQPVSASQETDFSRRYIITKARKAVTSLATFGLFAHPLLASAREKDRTIDLYVPATGESIRTIIWTPDEGYISESIREISILMRDRRNDKVHTMNTKTLDILAAVQSILKPRQPTEMLSGYRSPETNNMLRRNSSGVAKESYHVKAMAVDVRMPDRGRSQVEKVAKSLRAGGVGRYRRNDFTHLDSGPVRAWG